MIIPAYTCYSVAASIDARGPHAAARATSIRDTLGIDPRDLRDVRLRTRAGRRQRESLRHPERAAAKSNRSRANAASSCSTTRRRRSARESTGAPSARFGDAGLYSFDKGKIICTIAGRHRRGARAEARRDASRGAARMLAKPAMLEVTHELGQTTRVRAVSASGRLRRASASCRSSASDAPCTRPATRSTRLGRLQAGVALTLLPRARRRSTAARVRNAARLAAALAGMPGIVLPPSVRPRRTRLRCASRCACATPAVASAVVAPSTPRASARPSPIRRRCADVPEVAQLLREPIRIHARSTRRSRLQIVTLPTHGYCPPDLAARVRACSIRGAAKAMLCLIHCDAFVTPRHRYAALLLRRSLWMLAARRLRGARDRRSCITACCPAGAGHLSPTKPSSCRPHVRASDALSCARHFRPLSSGRRLRACSRAGEPLPDMSCLVTFDDGWWDNFEHALPILRDRGVPAAVFVATDYIGSERCFWQERLNRLLFRAARQGGEPRPPGRTAHRRDRRCRRSRAAPPDARPRSAA